MDIVEIFNNKILQLAIQEKKDYLINYLLSKGFVNVQDSIYVFDSKLDCQLSAVITNQEVIIYYNWYILNNNAVKLNFDLAQKNEIKFGTKTLTTFQAEFETALQSIVKIIADNCFLVKNDI